jgi:hypothetical protein
MAIQTLALRAVPAGLIGSRIYHVLTDWRSFEGRWIDVFKIWQGGLGIPGGMFTGVVVGMYFARRMGLHLGDLGDVVAPALPLAQASRSSRQLVQPRVVRAVRRRCRGAVRIDPQHRPARYAAVTSFQPTFLYEMLWNLALVGVICGSIKRRVVRRGRCSPSTSSATASGACDRVAPLRSGRAPVRCARQRLGEPAGDRRWHAPLLFREAASGKSIPRSPTTNSTDEPESTSTSRVPSRGGPDAEFDDEFRVRRRVRVDVESEFDDARSSMMTRSIDDERGVR